MLPIRSFLRGRLGSITLFYSASWFLPHCPLPPFHRSSEFLCGRSYGPSARRSPATDVSLPASYCVSFPHLHHLVLSSATVQCRSERNSNEMFIVLCILPNIIHLKLSLTYHAYMQCLRWGGMASRFFSKSPETIPLPRKIIPPPLSHIWNHPASFFFFSSVKQLLALLLFCTNSNVNMRRMAVMKELHYTLSV
jgi:hypothetical protein